MSYIDNCRRLIGIDSTPGQGNLAAAEFVGALCADVGLEVELQRETLDGLDQCNVIARPKQVTSPEILLQAHLDTADAGHFSHWTQTQSNPFNASIYNDTLFGLGAAEGKLDILCKLEAIGRIKGKPLKNSFALVGTYGAHSGMAGAIKLIRRKKLNARVALLGEATDLELVNAAKGITVIEISIPFSSEERAYRRLHDGLESASTQSRMFSSRVTNENAVMKMLDYLAQLPEGIAIMDLDGGVNHSAVPASAVLEVDAVAAFNDPILPKISRLYRGLLALEADLLRFREDGFDPPHPNVNMGMIRTFEADIRLTGSVRIPPSVTEDVYNGWMRGLEEAVSAEGATFRVRDYRAGFYTPESSEFVAKVKGVLTDMNMDNGLARSTMASEASVFSRYGMECLLWGPGRSVGNSHGPNESVKINDLMTAIDFYTRVLERLCL